MVRRFLDDFEEGFDRLRRSELKGRVSVVTGLLGEQFIEPMAQRINELPGLSVDVVPARNDFLGHGITVSGLLAGVDILPALDNSAHPGDRIILPPNCVNYEGFLLDGLSPDDLARAAGRPVEVGNYSLVDSLLAPSHLDRRAPSGVDHPYIASHQLP